MYVPSEIHQMNDEKMGSNFEVFLQSKIQVTPDSPILFLGPCESNHCRGRWIQMPGELPRGAVPMDAVGQRRLLKWL